MKRKTPPPAKLTRPSAGELLKRERLFAMLDAARAGKVVWITAPPGAGKTSLLATWIEARGLPCLWYAIDPGDADPASLFYRFATAARDGFGAVDIPPFGEGGGVPIGVFARRFFEAVLAGIEPPLVIVLDNYEELEPASLVHDAVDALFASAPPGVLVAVTCRSEPPPKLARWLAGSELTAIGFPDLRFTRAETGALAAARGIAPDGGWMRCTSSRAAGPPGSCCSHARTRRASRSRGRAACRRRRCSTTSRSRPLAAPRRRCAPFSSAPRS